MNTINPEIKLFYSEKAARKYYNSLNKPCHLLKAARFYYVDESKRALKDWPDLYLLLSDK